MKFFVFIAFLFSMENLISQELWMHKNQGQWDGRIEYKMDLQLGEFYIEKHRFLFYLHNADQKYRHSHDGEHSLEQAYNAHVISAEFIEANEEFVVREEGKSPFYRNYILGLDQKKWQSKVHSYSKVKKENFYNGVDLILTTGNAFEYSFQVYPNKGNPSDIKIKFTGQNDVFLDDKGQLIIKHRFGEIIQSQPKAWTISSNGRKKEVEIEYALTGDVLSFVFPKGYQINEILFIDPVLTFSTFTGATSDNWGTSATPDYNQNLIAGGIVFGPGYPLTTGVFDASFNNGNVDIGISKFTSDGSGLMFSTFLGGNGEEMPNSMICSTNNELFVFGVTSSSNFPMLSSSYDNTFGGGPSMAGSSNGIGFSSGTDIFIARLSADGSTLLGSTYLGGSGNDGMNVSNLKYNYGDQFRGEIIVDNMGSVYISSVTQSTNFPTTAGLPGLAWGQDAVIVKMPIALNQLTWSRYFGGDMDDTGNSICIGANGNIYVSGGTESNNLPINNGFQPSFGGDRDGYLVQINSTTGAIVSGTYIGANEYDQSYFVQSDLNGDIYVFGQTESDLGITSGLYGVANAGQFIHKYSSDLGTQLWKTMFGAGIGHVEISPTAFLVSDCGEIYVAGWGGQLNTNPAVSQAVHSTTNGFPVTSGAYQTTTNGSNFYIAVLGQDASSLRYGTFMGGITNSPNHVDGGTSRFDKGGRIYHAVCAACGGNSNGFTTTPGVYGPTNNSSNCNLAAFKFELSYIEAVVSDPSPTVCYPNPVVFSNNSSNGNHFFWDFGDGNTSTDINPTHVYPGPGNYMVTLIVSDTNGCYTPDTLTFPVEILLFTGNVIQPSDTICPNVPYQLEASGGMFYQWSPTQGLSDPTISNPIATISQTTTFTVIVSDTCGADTLQVTLPVYDVNYTVSDDQDVCIGNSVNLIATGGASYSWTPATFLSNPNISTPLCTPTQDIMYYVEIITPDGCVINDSVFVDVFYTPPSPVIPDTLIQCAGTGTEIIVSGATSYSWSPNYYISTTTGNTVTVNPPNDVWYYCDFTNICGTVTDSVFVDVKFPNAEAFSDTIICPGESVMLRASGGLHYHWTPEESINNPNEDTIIVTPTIPTNYQVTVTDMFGCVDVASVFVDLFPKPSVVTDNEVEAFYGEPVQLIAFGNGKGTFDWMPPYYLSCTDCSNPMAKPDENFTYTVIFTDNNGCKASDTVRVVYKPLIFAPNTFTPDGDEHNNVFRIIVNNVQSFQLLIFNRWGELIFESYDSHIGWDGTYGGALCQDGTYVWKLRVTSMDGEEEQYVGHVHLLR